MSATAILSDTQWLKSRTFDLGFIMGITLLAVASGLLVNMKPELFIYVLTADLWLLGYHHVASTYTRLAFDKHSLHEHRYKLTVLPVIVAISVTVICLVFGPWMLATIYLYWQWFHYTRQSEGISKAYAAKSRHQSDKIAKINRAVFWLIPLAGLVNLSAQSPGTFLFMPVQTLPVHKGIADVLNFIAATTYLWWVAKNTRIVLKNHMILPWFLYMNTHFFIYAVAYIVVDNINHGWLVINIWHNAQYILFVWLYNNKRFNGEVNDRYLFLSTISKNRNLILYLGVCFALSSGVYFLIERFGVDSIETMFGVSSMAAAMIIYQTINFHHYIVDATIWKLRKKPIRDTLGLSD